MPVSKARAKTKDRRRQALRPRPLRRIPPQSDTYLGKANAYTCPHGHVTVTVDLDAGVTPSGVPCPRMEQRGHPPVAVECLLHATSAWYRPPRGLAPTHEWYRPDDDERRRLSRDFAEHVDMGGLLLRRITVTEVGTDG